MRYKNMDTTFCRFVTNRAFDRQTDRFLIARPRLHSIPRGKKRLEIVKNVTRIKRRKNVLHLWQEVLSELSTSLFTCCEMLSAEE